MDDDADEPDAPQAAASSSDETTTPRPEDMTLGFGFGYTLPADVQQISQASVRLRLVSGLTLEPIVRLATVGESLNDGDIKNANNEVTFGSNVRIPLKERGKVSLIGQIGAGVSFTIDDPDGSDNNTTTFAVALDWGAGVEWWFNQHWSLSVTGRNPFVSYVSTTQELGAGLDDKQSTTRIGAIWDPAIDIAVHLFY